MEPAFQSVPPGALAHRIDYNPERKPELATAYGHPSGLSVSGGRQSALLRCRRFFGKYLHQRPASKPARELARQFLGRITTRADLGSVGPIDDAHMHAAGRVMPRARATRVASPLQASFHGSFQTIDEKEWSRLASGSQSGPFTSYNFLRSLEESGCVSEESGWQPMHMTLHADGRMVCGAALYLRCSSSSGEFVPQDTWERLAGTAGEGPYFPKLTCAVPFTPASGARILTDPSMPRPHLLREASAALRRLVDASGISSGHVNFCTPEEASVLQSVGFIPRYGVQYHFFPSRFTSFEGFLAALRSGRRIQIRRERRAVREAGVSVRVLRGAQITPEVMARAYELYEASVARVPSGAGRQYVNRRWFELVGEHMRPALVVLAAYRAGRMIAATVNFVQDGVMYGRYWGCEERVPFLHFEVCYYAAIEFCIQEGIRRFEPGQGGEFKWFRGFEPTLVSSGHYFRDLALSRSVSRLLKGELAFVADEIEARQLLSPLKRPS